MIRLRETGWRIDWCVVAIWCAGLSPWLLVAWLVWGAIIGGAVGTAENESAKNWKGPGSKDWVAPNLRIPVWPR